MRNLKKVLALVLALVMSLSLVTIANAADFSDNADINYKEAVDVMNAIGVIDGLDTGAFNPQGTLTREQAAKIICTMLLGDGAEKLGTQTSSFTDVAATRWSSPYIEYCVQTGIVAGVGNGQFNPTGKLTGHAFAKMLLVALGYDPTIQSYTGSGWNVNVAKDAVAAGIDVDGVLMSNDLTREQATQMAFQALTATMVYYTSKGTNITLENGTTIVTGASDPTPVGNNSGKDYRVVTADRDTYMQFCEQYFDDLTYDAKDADTFSRPAHTWTYGKDFDGTYADDSAVLVYTAETKAATVKSDLKGYDYEAGLKASVNSDTGASIASYSDVAALTADGTIVEVYATDKEVDAVIVIQTAAAKVTAVNTTKKTFTISYNTNKTLVIDEDSDFYGLYDVVEKDDILAVSFAADSTVLDLYIPTTVTGEITYVKSDSKQATVDGETVKAAATAGALFAGTLSQDSVVYLNEAGYAIYVDAATTSDANYIYVTNMWSKEDTSYGSTGDYTYYALGVKADGTIETIEIANSTNTDTIDASEFGMSASLAYGDAATNAVKFNDGSKPNAVYEYTESTSTSGLYLLTVPATGNTSTEGVTADASAAVSSSDSKISGVYMSSDVTFVYVSGNGDDVKASVGDKAAIASDIHYQAVVEEVGSRHLVTVVFVKSSSTTSADVIYISKALGSVKYTDADGKTKTGMKVEYYAYGSDSLETMTVAQGSSSAVGFYTLSTDGDAFKTSPYGTEDTDKRTTIAVTDMYNGYATVDGTEYDLNDALIVDVADEGISSVAALEDAVNTDNQVVSVSFTYNADGEVEAVYVQSVKSNDVAIDSVTVNGATATVSGSTGGTAVEVAKNAALTLVVNLSDSNASYVVTYDDNTSGGASYGEFTNGVSTSADADTATGEFKIVVTAEDGAATATYYVAFVTPTPAP